MQSELERRKEAVKLYYYQNKTKAQICKRLKCTRGWLQRWLERYDPDDVEASLHNRKPGPLGGNSPWSVAIRQQVVEMRRARSAGEFGPYALQGVQGAAAIHYELQALASAEVPPVRTIHRWLVAAGLVHPEATAEKEKTPKALPLPAAEAVNAVQQLDLKGPLYLRNSSHKYYLVVLRDCYSRRCAIDALASRQAQGIVDFLVRS